MEHRFSREAVGLWLMGCGVNGHAGRCTRAPIFRLSPRRDRSSGLFDNGPPACMLAHALPPVSAAPVGALSPPRSWRSERRSPEAAVNQRQSDLDICANVPELAR